MHCLSCNADIGNNLGLCPECAAKRQQKIQDREALEARYQEHAKAREMYYVKLGALVVILVCLAVLVPILFRDSYTMYVDGGTLKISITRGASETSLKYWIKGPVVAEARVVSFDVLDESTYKSTGARFGITWVDEKDYEKLPPRVIAGGLDSAIAAGALSPKQYRLVLRTADLKEPIAGEGIAPGDKVMLEGNMLDRIREGDESAEATPAAGVSVVMLKSLAKAPQP